MIFEAFLNTYVLAISRVAARGRKTCGLYISKYALHMCVYV